MTQRRKVLRCMTNQWFSELGLVISETWDSPPHANNFLSRSDENVQNSQKKQLVSPAQSAGDQGSRLYLCALPPLPPAVIPLLLSCLQIIQNKYMDTLP